MKIHEYQAKQILATYGVPVPAGEPVFQPSDAKAVAERLGGGTVVVKAQIHAGGRGKGGGVKLAANPAEAEKLANQIYGMNLVTHQTGPEGRRVSRLLIEQGLPIARELYLGIVIDRAAGWPVIMAMPIRISTAPAAIWRSRPTRPNVLRRANSPSVNSAASRNGTPSPRE